MEFLKHLFRNEPDFFGSIVGTWYQIALILILVLFLVLRNVIKLMLDRRRRVLGSGLRSRLVLAFVTLSLVHSDHVSAFPVVCADIRGLLVSFSGGNLHGSGLDRGTGFLRLRRGRT